MDDQTPSPAPHVLIFPLPIQSPVSGALKLAEFLCLAGFHVTFLTTDHILRRLRRSTDVHSRFSRFPRFRFESFSDGLPDHHPRTGDLFMEMFDSVQALAKPLFRKYLLITNSDNDGTPPPVTCVIPDGAFRFPLDIAEEVGVPLIFFETLSPCSVLVYLSFPTLIDAGELPFNDDNLDAPVLGVPVMEGFLRRRDLPNFCRVDHHPTVKHVLELGQQFPRANGIILNTCEEIDGPTLIHIQSLCPNLYAIGPLHAHMKTRSTSEIVTTYSNSLWEEDIDCMNWLDAQSPKSVIYVSFGSLIVSTMEELMEFWHGLVNSGKRFLWVIRDNAIVGMDWDRQIPTEVLEGTIERGCIIKWAPQEKVLAHPAVGGFLTHSGWNSTLESMVAGVPMICFPCFVDQQVSSRFVSEVWKIGLDMKDNCTQSTIEKMICDLMGPRKEEFTKSSDRVAKIIKESVSEGGSSYCNLNRLIEDIRLMAVTPRLA